MPAEALNAANTFIYKEDWAQRLRERLNEPNVWKEACDVLYTDTRVLNMPYLADITLQDVGRSSPYTFQAVSETNESLTINQARHAPFLIGEADLHQGYAFFMDLAARQAAQLDAQVESYVWQQNTDWENFDGVDIGGSAGSITVSISNIDDIITNLKKTIFAARGGELLGRNGGFIVWHPGDFAKVEQWAMASGFTFADEVLRDGIRFGFRAGGLYHYVSSRLDPGRCHGGVKGVVKVGILKSTYGVPKFLEDDPGQVAGVGIRSTVNYGVMTPLQWRSLIFDIAVA